MRDIMKLSNSVTYTYTPQFIHETLEFITFSIYWKSWPISFPIASKDLNIARKWVSEKETESSRHSRYRFR